MKRRRDVSCLWPMVLRPLRRIFQTGDVVVLPDEEGENLIQFRLRQLRRSGEDPQGILLLAGDDGVMVVGSEADDSVVAVEMLVERDFQRTDHLPAFETCDAFHAFHFAVLDAGVDDFHGAVRLQRVFRLYGVHVAFKPFDDFFENARGVVGFAVSVRPRIAARAERQPFRAGGIVETVCLFIALFEELSRELRRFSVRSRPDERRLELFKPCGLSKRGAGQLACLRVIVQRFVFHEIGEEVVRTALGVEGGRGREGDVSMEGMPSAEPFRIGGHDGTEGFVFLPALAEIAGIVEPRDLDAVVSHELKPNRLQRQQFALIGHELRLRIGVALQGGRDGQGDDLSREVAFAEILGLFEGEEGDAGENRLDKFAHLHKPLQLLIFLHVPTSLRHDEIGAGRAFAEHFRILEALVFRRVFERIDGRAKRHVRQERLRLPFL